MRDLPKFQNDAEAAAWFDTHDTAAFMDKQVFVSSYRTLWVQFILAVHGAQAVFRRDANSISLVQSSAVGLTVRASHQVNAS